MTTLSTLRSDIARDLRDASQTTFAAQDISDFVDAGIAQLGRISPYRFREDITPLLNTLHYVVQSANFSVPDPNIEVKRVELWNVSTSPETFFRWLTPQAQHYTNTSAVGWEFFNGTLYLTNDEYNLIDVTRHVIRVQGFAPYPRMTDANATLQFTYELEMALRAFCRMEGLARLVASRDLYAQWQIQSDNTDISPAGLMQMLAASEGEWRHRAHELLLVRGGQ